MNAGTLYVLLKKYQGLFDRLGTQIVLWDSAVANGAVLFSNTGSTISKLNNIATHDSLGVLDQFDGIRALLIKKYYDRLEQVARGIRGYVSSLERAYEKMHLIFLEGSSLFQKLTQPPSTSSTPKRPVTSSPSPSASPTPSPSPSPSRSTSPLPSSTPPSTKQKKKTKKKTATTPQSQGKKPSPSTPTSPFPSPSPSPSSSSPSPSSLSPSVLLSPSDVCFRTEVLPSLIEVYDWLEWIHNSYQKQYFTKRDMLDRLEIEFMRGKDSDLFEQTAALWSADQVTSDKAKKILHIMANLASEIV